MHKKPCDTSLPTNTEIVLCKTLKSVVYSPSVHLRKGCIIFSETGSIALDLDELKVVQEFIQAILEKEKQDE